jgi:hypothetical protein
MSNLLNWPLVIKNTDMPGTIGPMAAAADPNVSRAR